MDLEYTAIGVATINGKITTIRKYDNGFHVVEVNETQKYSSRSLEELEKALREDDIDYIITEEK